MLKRSTLLSYGALLVKVLEPSFPVSLAPHSKEELACNAIREAVRDRDSRKTVWKPAKRRFKQTLRADVEALYGSWSRVKGELGYTVEDAYEYASALVDKAWERVFPQGTEGPTVTGRAGEISRLRFFQPIRRDLVQELRVLAGGLGRAVNSMADEAVEQQLVASRLGVTLPKATEAYSLLDICRRAGGSLLSAELVDYVVQTLTPQQAEAWREKWREYGCLLGFILESRFGEKAFEHLRKMFEYGFLSGKLEIAPAGEMNMRLLDPNLSLQVVKLYAAMLEGILEKLGYRVVKSEQYRGLAVLSAEIRKELSK